MILILDDDKRHMHSYIAELDLSHFNYSFQPDVDSAVRFFSENQESIDLVILDVAMPPGDSFTLEEIEGGLRTGELFYKWVRGKAPTLPIMVLTNTSDKMLSGLFERGKCWIYRKTDVLPFELVEKIEAILAEG